MRASRTSQAGMPATLVGAVIAGALALTAAACSSTGSPASPAGGPDGGDSRLSFSLTPVIRHRHTRFLAGPRAARPARTLAGQPMRAGARAEYLT